MADKTERTCCVRHSPWADQVKEDFSIRVNTNTVWMALHINQSASAAHQLQGYSELIDKKMWRETPVH